MIEKKESVIPQPKGHGWMFYAVLSAVFASLTTILGKVGVENIDSNLGTALRTVVVLVMAWAIVLAKGKQKGIAWIDGKLSLIHIFNQRTRNLMDNFGGMEGYLQSPANVWDKLPALIQEGNLPRLYFCSGTDDFLYPNYVAFKEYAQQIGLPATFEEADGFAHEWAFWDLFKMCIRDRYIYYIHDNYGLSRDLSKIYPRNDAQ